ncbi:kinesin-like protein KIF9 [Watersipora subatra]|uniref:kinesin-like protein KIF9 n=1 Tax=Watersipora subatra TaxID=2589382 RepID=UPI00355B7957
MSASRSKKVKVWVRTRPTGSFANDNIDLKSDGKTVNLHIKREERHGVVNNQILDWSFKMDGILHNSEQQDVFEKTAKPLITRCLNGYNGTMLCYGQTGAGKTFTMTGATENYSYRGLIPRALQQLYKDIEEKTDYSINVRISYLEIYNEHMVDLLASQPFLEKEGAMQMAIGEDENGVYVKGLTQHLAQTEEEALNLLFEGETNRVIAQHSMNAASSRSHCIFMLNVEARSRVMSNAVYTTSKLNFVDLAGSERLSKTLSEGKVKEEAMYINKSLSFLEQCVIALADRRRDHIPFRQSKLTHVLKDSIGGSCDTILIANVWGEREQLDETVSTLRFATRMMCVASEPAVNEQVDPTLMVKKLEKDIQNLKRELAMHDTLNNRSMVTYEALSEQQKYEIKQQVRRYISSDLDTIDIINIKQIEGVYESFKEICLSTELDVEARLRDKYTLIDKTDPEQIKEAQARGINIADDGTVGEPDGTGFGLGIAPSSAKAADISNVSVRGGKGGKRRGKERQSPAPAKTPPTGVGVRPAEGRTPSPQTEKKDAPAADLETISPVTSASPEKTAPTIPRPSTPPTRTQAFEDFKKEKGSEINRIFVQNQEVLAQKKKSYSQLARQINSIKSEIDKTMERLDQLKKDRENEGFTYNEDGETIISEEEFLEIKNLKTLKQNYRLHHDDLKALRAEIQYCQKLVDQCRHKLIKEFDSWYATSFIAADDPTQTSEQAGFGQRQGTSVNPDVGLEDEGEKFERLHEQLLMEDPESVAFQNARVRTDRRKTYERAISQTQPAQKSTKKPGTPTRIMNNKPPAKLEIQIR